MPFSETTKEHTSAYWDSHYSDFLEPIIDSCESVKASRSRAFRQDIQRQIINDLVFSDTVSADLTDANVNVYWELGVRLSFRHGTVTIAEEGTKIPFDINTKGILFYKKERSKRESFVLTLKEAIAHCLTNPNSPDSFVLEAITGRGSIYSVIHHQEILQRIEGLLVECKLNVTLFEKAIDIHSDNENRRFGFLRLQYATLATKLSTSALDLLVAEHYLEEDSAFYEDAHVLLALIHACNKAIDNWSTNKDSSKWLIERQFDIKQELAKYQKRLYAAKEKLSKSC
jgi:hypothetical protein